MGSGFLARSYSTLVLSNNRRIAAMNHKHDCLHIAFQEQERQIPLRQNEPPADHRHLKIWGGEAFP